MVESVTCPLVPIQNPKSKTQNAAWLLLLWMMVCAPVLAQAPAEPDTSRPGARLAFPDHGAVHALVIFVQHADVADGAGDFGSDPETEWPHGRSLGPERRLPAWAEDDRLLAPPGTDPAAFDEGSLSAFYDLMSHGRFHLTGYIYPRVYIPEQPVDAYHTNRGDLQNGAVALAHEILTSDELQTYLDDNPDGLDLATLDTYRNGTNTYEPDGIFDLIILIHRDLTLPRLRKSDGDEPIAGSSITSFGVDNVLRPSDPTDFTDPTTDAFASAPVALGGLRVIDNLTSGSGITVNALTRKQAVRIIAHEVGHRQFGFYHTCESVLSPDSDCIGVMTGSGLTMSAGDRIKLGWAEVVPMDLPALGRLDATFPDALASGQVFRLRLGENQCGDVIVEARRWTNFWDSPPNPDNPDAPFYQNDDGDQGDIFLPEEGLYLYKAPEPGNPRCGGNNTYIYDEQTYSSLENNGLGRRLSPFRAGPSNEMKAFRVGGTYRTAYAPGDIYAPYTLPRFFYHQHFALDAKLTLTNIRRTDEGYAAELWTDYLTGPPDANQLRIETYPNPFNDYLLVRYELTEAMPATVALYDVLGRHLMTLTDGLHQPGVHEVYFETLDLPSGVYYARVRFGGRTVTRAVQRIR